MRVGDSALVWHLARLRGLMSASSRGFEHALSSPDEPHNLRVRTGAEVSASAGDGGPGLPRSQSLGSFLDLRDVNITEDGEGSVGGARAAPRCATGKGPVVTPRAAPCIALPKQNRETLRHFAIGARVAPKRRLCCGCMSWSDTLSQTLEVL